MANGRGGFLARRFKRTRWGMMLLENRHHPVTKVTPLIASKEGIIFCSGAEDGGKLKILSDFFKLCFIHNILTFAAAREVPPFDLNY